MGPEDEYLSIEEQYFSDCFEDWKAFISDESDAIITPVSSQNILAEKSQEDTVLELSLQDVDEEQSLSKFFEEPCCINQCNFVIAKDKIIQSRNNCLELEKESLDLVILSQIESGKGDNEFFDAYEDVLGKKKYGKRKDDDSSKSHVNFYFRQLPICRGTFLFLHACGLKRYKTLLKHFDNNGVVVRSHSSKNKQCTNPIALLPSEITSIVEFIKSTADRLAIPLPGRLPQFKDFRVMKLPSSETKSTIYRTYVSSLKQDERKISLQSFRKIWNRYVPYITVMKPRDDLCDICRGIF